jgi:hypothetical protein
MAIGAILDVLFDRNWMYRIDKKELARIYGVDEIKIERTPKITDTFYSYKDANSGRILFMVQRMGKKAGLNLIDFIDKDEAGHARTKEFDSYSGARRSVFVEVEDDQLSFVVVKDKALYFISIDKDKEKLLRVASHFDEKRIF